MSVLKKNEDPLGAALLDYLKGNKAAMIKTFSSLEGEDFMSAKWLFRSRQEMPALEKLALVNCVGRVLDVGAGAGSHSLALQSMGLDVIALDSSPGAVEVMKKRGVSKVILSDILNYSDHLFDTLLFLMNGSGIGGHLQGLRKLLVKAGSLLKPGGRILMDSSDIVYMFEDDEFTARDFFGKNYYGEVTFTMEYEGIIGKPFPWLYVDYYTLSSLVKELGFEINLVYEGDTFEYLAMMTKT